MLDKIPAPQAAALEGALALRPGAGHDRFAVGAATLSLLAAYADLAPVAVLVDDAQWLDGSSAQALLFAVRRLVADPIAVFVAVREDEPSFLDGADLPVLRIGGLTSDEAAMLVPGLAPEAARRLHRATAGNPLALLELAPDAPDMALAPDGAPVLVSTRISGAFLRRASGQVEQGFGVAGGDLGAVRGVGDGVEELPDRGCAGLVEGIVGREQHLVGAGEVESVAQQAFPDIRPCRLNPRRSGLG